VSLLWLVGTWALRPPKINQEDLRLIGKLIEWVLEVLGIESLGSLFAVVVALVIGVLITVIPSMVIAAFLVFLAIRAGPSIFGTFVQSSKFIPVISVICIVVPTVLMWLSGGPLPAVGAFVGAILPVMTAQSALREFQEARRKDRPSENASP
jgi:uncharacterized transporter YbjL